MSDAPTETPPADQHTPAREVAPAPALKTRPAWLNPTTGIAAGAGLVVGILLTLGIGAIGGAVADAAEAAAAAEAAIDDRITQAYKSCDKPEGMTLGRDGQSLTVDGKGEDDFEGAGLTDILCVLEALEIPDSTLGAIDQTRALDGRQKDDWDGIEISWSYHPDSGMSAVIEVEK